MAGGRMHTPHPTPLDPPLAMSYRNHQKSLAYFSYWAPLILFFLLKDRVKRGGMPQCPPRNVSRTPWGCGHPGLRNSETEATAKSSISVGSWYIGDMEITRWSDVCSYSRLHTHSAVTEQKFSFQIVNVAMHSLLCVKANRVFNPCSVPSRHATGYHVSVEEKENIRLCNRQPETPSLQTRTFVWFLDKCLG